MKRFILTLLLLFSFTLSGFATEELIVDFEEDSVPVLNEELRKLKVDVDDVQANLDAITANVVVQIVNTTVVTSTTGNTAMPLDDTAPPQNDEGTEFITLAITPTSSTNALRIQGKVNVATSTTSTNIIGALFQDSTANALDVDAQYNGGAENSIKTLVFDHYMTAGTTSATTFKIRVGDPSGGTITLNGRSGSRLFGGVMGSSITITEIKV